MKVRIRHEPRDGVQKWVVETKQWWEINWQYADSCIGDNAQERALALANQYKNPVVIEVVSK